MKVLQLTITQDVTAAKVGWPEIKHQFKATDKFTAMVHDETRTHYTFMFWADTKHNGRHTRELEIPKSKCVVAELYGAF